MILANSYHIYQIDHPVCGVWYIGQYGHFLSWVIKQVWVQNLEQTLSFNRHLVISLTQDQCIIKEQQRKSKQAKSESKSSEVLMGAGQQYLLKNNASEVHKVIFLKLNTYSFRKYYAKCISSSHHHFLFLLSEFFFSPFFSFFPCSNFPFIYPTK